MNVLMVLPFPIAKRQVVQSWASRLTPEDQLYIATFYPFRLDEICGLDIHRLDFQGRPPGGRREAITHAALDALKGLWPSLALAGARRWSEFLWNLRSFDPDLIDLRWVAGSHRLKARLQPDLPHILILAHGENLEDLCVDTSWRQYDPTIRVSIILPIYNGAKYLRQAIQGCLAQTHPAIELVIVDDCSTDETPSIIAEYAGDPRVVRLRNPRNLRLPGALNAGFSRAAGELLTWTSHDNFHAPTAVETLVRYLCTWRDIGLVYSAYYRMNERGDIDPQPKYLPPPWAMPWLNIVGPYFLYRRAVYATVGDYREDLELAEDYEYWVRVWKRFNLMRLPVPLYYYRHHSESLTARMSDTWSALTERIQREHFPQGVAANRGRTA